MLMCDACGSNVDVKTTKILSSGHEGIIFAEPYPPPLSLDLCHRCREQLEKEFAKVLEAFGKKREPSKQRKQARFAKRKNTEPAPNTRREKC